MKNILSCVHVMLSRAGCASARTINNKLCRQQFDLSRDFQFVMDAVNLFYMLHESLVSCGSRERHDVDDVCLVLIMIQAKLCT